MLNQSSLAAPYAGFEESCETGLTHKFPRHLLVPLDLSDISRKNLRYAARLAAEAGAELSILHVVNPVILSSEDGIYLPPPQDGVHEAEESLAQLVHEEAACFGEHLPQTYVRYGPTFSEIARVAEECGADLIVVGSHGYRGVKRLLLGSTADALVRHASVPVLVTREGSKLPRETPPLGKAILVPVDFSEHAEGAIAYAVALAAYAQGHVSLAHVLDPTDPDGNENWCGCDAATLAADVHSRLNALMERTVPTAFRGKTHALVGSPYVKIAALGGSEHADLIIITTHGRTGLAHLLLGSTAERILHHSWGPVMVVRR